MKDHTPTTIKSSDRLLSLGSIKAIFLDGVFAFGLNQEDALEEDFRRFGVGRFNINAHSWARVAKNMRDSIRPEITESKKGDGE